MKPISQAELESLSPLLQTLVGARFQEFETTETQLALGFYSHGQLIWWIFELSKAAPTVACLESWPLKSKSKKTPLQLFCRAHLVNRILNSVQVVSSLGRVLLFDFGGRHLEIRLFPHGTNAIVKSEEKTISFYKVEPLEPANFSQSQLPLRNIVELSAEWLGRTRIENKKSRDPEKQIQKKQKALEILEKQQANEEWKIWQAAGEWVKANQSLKVPEEYVSFIDAKLSLSENLNRLFAKSKMLQGKEDGTRDRIMKLKQEIQALQVGEVGRESRPEKSKPSEAKQRTIHLSDMLLLKIGKSGTDNLRLIRESQAWDFWLHLKDYPGAHAILTRPRGVEVSQKVLEVAACWLGRESNKAKLREGDRFEVLIAEIRHIRPIKGDRHGRVNYQNERVIRCLYKDPK
jgi:predicted ribosome quality control (RQC) complex YloA/Tae2 family protein